MHEKPEKRDVVEDTNPEGKHYDEKTEETQVHEKPVKSDVIVDINPKGKYDNEKKGEKQLYEKPEKRDVIVHINTKGEYDEKKTVKEHLYEKPEKMDVVADINSEGKYDDNNLLEDDREHLTKGDGFEDTEGMKDENTEGNRDEGSNDEDDKMEAMLTNPDSKHMEVDNKHREVDVVEEKGNMIQVQVEQFLNGMRHKSTAAEHDIQCGTQASIVIHGNDHGMTRLLDDNAVKKVDEDDAKTYDQTENEDMLKEAYQRKNDDREEDDENDDEKQLNTQWVDMQNQLGVAQEHGALDNKTTESVDMIIKRDGFEDTKEVKDEDVEGMRDEGSKVEDSEKTEDNTEKMTGFYKDEYFIKGDGFKDNSEDTADEEMMKQDEAPKTKEVIKKELQLRTSEMLLTQRQRSKKEF
jgi:hypothetical protein